MAENIEDFRGTARFKIVRRLGSGGFGVVYQVFDLEQETLVALKTLHEFSASALIDLKKEFRSLADFTHPNLVSLYELLAEGNQWFFTMEMVEGINFKEYIHDSCSLEAIDPADMPTLQTAPQAFESRATFVSSARTRKRVILNYDRLRTATTQLVTGIMALHDAGKLHCDIKPSNVLVTDSDRVVILDFGLVKDIRPLFENIHLAEIVGTPVYMSPEQGAGSILTPASDWYSVGVMLFEALTDRWPFNGLPLDIIKNKGKFVPLPPAAINPGIPEELNQLCIDLLRMDAEARPTGAEILQRLGASTPPPETVINPVISVTTAPAGLFVGRERELAELRDSYRASRSDCAVISLVHGSSGMGKSTLVRHFLEQLSYDLEEPLIFAGRCYQQESVPYKALDSVVDAISAYLAAIADDEVAELVPADLPVLAQLFPVLRQLKKATLPEHKSLAATSSQELRRRAFAAFGELLKNLSIARPIILFIDDLQWGDLDSAILLQELFGASAPPPILLIATYRSEEETTSPLLLKLLPLCAQGALNAEIHQISIGAFERNEAQVLTKLLLANSTQTTVSPETIIGESGGSPFFIGELARYLLSGEQLSGHEQETKITLDEVIQQRVGRLPRPAHDLLELVAVAGQPINIEIAKEVLEMRPLPPNILMQLRAGHFIRIRETRSEEEIESYHDRIREIICRHIEPDRSKKYNLRLARALETAGNADPERLMNHFYSGGNYHKALEYSNIAADKANSALAFDRAARLYRLALKLCNIEENKNSTTFRLSTRMLHIKLGDALSNAGRGAEAAEAYLSAAHETAIEEERIDLRRRAAEQLLISGHINEGTELLNKVLNSLGMSLAKTRNHALVSVLLRRLQIRWRGLDFVERRESEIPPKDLLRVNACWTVALGLSNVDTVRGADYQARHLLLALECGEPYRIARALAFEAAHNSAAGSANVKRTDELLSAAQALSTRIGNMHAIGLTTFIKGFTQFMRGNFRSAHELDDEAEAIFREHCKGMSWELGSVHVNSLHALLFLGEISTIRNRLRHYLQEAESRGDLYAQIILRCRIAYFINLLLDRPGQAREELNIVKARWSQQEFYQQHFWLLLGETELELYQGNSREAFTILHSRDADLKRSFTLRAQVFRILWNFINGRCLLALSGNDRGALKRVADHAQKIISEKSAWAEPCAHLLLSAVANQRGDQQKALALLAQSEKAFTAGQMALFKNISTYCKGELLNSDEGQQAKESALAWMRAQQIKEPLKVIKMYAPGYIS